jgi:hypothetical protein
MSPAIGIVFRAVTSCGEVKIGDKVQYEGRTYIVLGFGRLSSSTQHVLIEHEETEERKTVPLTELIQVR